MKDTFRCCFAKILEQIVHVESSDVHGHVRWSTGLRCSDGMKQNVNKNTCL